MPLDPQPPINQGKMTGKWDEKERPEQRLEGGKLEVNGEELGKEVVGGVDAVVIMGT